MEIGKIKRKIDIEIRSRLKIMSDQKTIRYILKNNCSVARYGDGEFKLMFDEESLRFQPYSDELRGKLKSTMKNRPEKLLICVPHSMRHVKGYNRKAKEFWKKWRWFHLPEVVKEIKLYCGQDYTFGDTQITRPYMDYSSFKQAEIIFPMLQKLWDKRDLMIVEGKETRLGIGNDLFDNARTIKRILAPNKNAFSVYDKLFQTIKKNYNGELILLALGPTATILAADLCRSGIQAIDVGHVDIEYEWFLRRSEDKEQIEGKYVNEIDNGTEVDDCKDQKYLSQIMEIVE